MARADTSTFGQFKILLGDGATPVEAFAPICGLTSKGINFETETTTVEVPDCTDEDLPAYKEEGPKSYAVTLSGSGMWAAQSHGTLLNWWKSGTSKNIKVQYAEAASGEPEFIEGPAIIKSIGNTVDKGGRLSADLAFAFTEMPTFTNAS
jgi:hypothetical protein